VANQGEVDMLDDISQFKTVPAILNNLDRSLSLNERQAKRFTPIYQELLAKMV